MFSMTENSGPSSLQSQQLQQQHSRAFLDPLAADPTFLADHPFEHSHMQGHPIDFSPDGNM
jgi:hypothetical protein